MRNRASGNLDIGLRLFLNFAIPGSIANAKPLRAFALTIAPE